MTAPRSSAPPPVAGDGMSPASYSPRTAARQPDQRARRHRLQRRGGGGEFRHPRLDRQGRAKDAAQLLGCGVDVDQHLARGRGCPSSE